MAAAIRKEYDLDKAHRASLGRVAAGDAPAPADPPAQGAPKSLWSHHGAVHESLRAAN
jgi:hypothetical protein